MRRRGGEASLAGGEVGDGGGEVGDGGGEVGDGQGLGRFGDFVPKSAGCQQCRSRSLPCARHTAHGKELPQ